MGLSAEDFDRLHRHAVINERMFHTMDPIPGCSEVLWRLSDAGVWVRIITHRIHANWGHAIAVADTVAWLDRVGIPYRDICFLGRKPEVEADAYLDDGPHNVVALREAGNDVIVFDQPYNRDLPGPRAHTWDEVEQHVIDLMTLKGFGLQVQLPGMNEGANRLTERLGPSPD